MTHPSRRARRTDSLRTFSGQLITSGTFANVSAVKVESGETGSFRITMGHAGTHPAGDPFTIRRI